MSTTLLVFQLISISHDDNFIQCFCEFTADSVVCVVNAAPPLKYFVIYNSPATCAFISYYALTMFYVRVTSCFVGGN